MINLSKFWKWRPRSDDIRMRKVDFCNNVFCRIDRQLKLKPISFWSIFIPLILMLFVCFHPCNIFLSHSLIRFLKNVAKLRISDDNAFFYPIPRPFLRHHHFKYRFHTTISSRCASKGAYKLLYNVLRKDCQNTSVFPSHIITNQLCQPIRPCHSHH